MKTISHDDYLKAKALFHMAHQGARQARTFETALLDLLGCGNAHLEHIGHDGFAVEPEATA